MLKPLFIVAFISLLCLQSCISAPIKTISTPRELGWQALLLVDPEISRPTNEEGKRRRITPKSVFIAPAFSGTSPLPDCPEGHRANSMGVCVKLVQLNHAAQIDFLLQRLNAMYASPIVRREYDDLSTSDSGPLQVNIPLDLEPEPEEEETKESVEVAVVMADVLKDDRVKNTNKKSEIKNSQTIVAVWNVGKNGTTLEEIESASDLGNQSVEKSVLTSSNVTKYEIVNEGENATLPKTRVSLKDDEQLLSTAPTTVLLPEESVQTMPEQVKIPGSAMALLEEIGNISLEAGRPGNTSRRNVSLLPVEESSTVTEESVTATEETVVNYKNTSSNMSQPEIQVTSETKINIQTSTPRPSTFVRFPTEKSNIVGNAVPQDDRQSIVKFPESHYMKQISMLPSDVEQRQTFWWLPAGWRLDPTRHQPLLIRFWARMPLARDESVADGYQDYAHRRRGALMY